MQNYYELLECAQNSSYDDLRQSYLRLAKIHHPDKQTFNESTNDVISSDKFTLIDKAWKTLSDPASRKEYDAKLSEHNAFLSSYADAFEKITLNQMKFDAQSDCYVYTCRCGADYFIENGDVLNVVIECDQCSLKVLIQQ